MSRSSSLGKKLSVNRIIKNYACLASGPQILVKTTGKNCISFCYFNFPFTIRYDKNIKPRNFTVMIRGNPFDPASSDING